MALGSLLALTELQDGDRVLYSPPVSYRRTDEAELVGSIGIYQNYGNTFNFLWETGPHAGNRRPTYVDQTLLAYRLIARRVLVDHRVVYDSVSGDVLVQLLHEHGVESPSEKPAWPKRVLARRVPHG